jgi:hypothetical protein
VRMGRFDRFRKKEINEEEKIKVYPGAGISAVIGGEPPKTNKEQNPFGEI